MIKRIEPLKSHELCYIRNRPRKLKGITNPTNGRTVGLFGPRDLKIIDPGNLSYEVHYELYRNYWITVTDESKVTVKVVVDD